MAPNQPNYELGSVLLFAGNAYVTDGSFIDFPAIAGQGLGVPFSQRAKYKGIYQS